MTVRPDSAGLMSLSLSMRRGWLGLLLCALLTAQTLGLVHRAAHSQSQRSPVSVSGPAAAGQVTEGLKSLIPAHADAGACLLFDQVCHGGSFGLEAIPVPAAIAFPFLLPRIAGLLLARRASPFEARGPPSLR